MRVARRSEAAVEPPRPEAVPGLEAARRAFIDAQQHEADLARGLPSIEREGAMAAAAIERVAWRVKVHGGPALAADAEERAAAEAVIAGVPGRVAIQQDAIRQAEAETKAAERHLAGVMRAEAKRRAPFVKAEADAALARSLADRARHNRLDVLASALLRVETTGRTVDAAEDLLRHSEEFAASAGTVGIAA
jgi:hypothetical protein